MSEDFYSLFNKTPAPARDLASVTPLDPDRAGRYATKALNSECENVAAAPEGQRNHTLNRAAYSISQLVAGGYLPRDDAWNALHQAGRAAGLHDQEIDATLASGFRGGAQTPRVVTERPPLPDPTILTDQLDAPAEGMLLNAPVDWHHLFSTEDEGEEWIVEPLLPARRMVALYSAPKAGKSLLMLELAVGIARGAPVIGATPDRARRVLYIDFENDLRGDVRSRLEAMEIRPHDLDNLIYLSFPSLAKFDTAMGADDLMRHVDAYECEVVVIDTLSRAVQGDENENDTWLSFYRHAGLALKRAGVACVRLDHSGKDTSKGMRGGSAKSGDVDAVWRLSAIGDETILLECTDHRMPVPTKTLTLVRSEFPLSHTLNADPMSAITDARQREVDQHLDALGVPSQATNAEARNALKAAGHKYRNELIAKVVKLRQSRLDMPVPAFRERSGNASGVPGTVVPGTPPSKGGSGTVPGTYPEQAGNGPAEADLLVGCKRCFTPTLQAIHTANGGLCATCHRDTGGVA